jgi:hypothetical protein
MDIEGVVPAFPTKSLQKSYKGSANTKNVIKVQEPVTLIQPSRLEYFEPKIINNF